MAKIIIIGFITFLFQACNLPSKNNKEEPSHLQGRITTIIEAQADTILNGGTFYAKVYLSDDSLYDEAKNNGILTDYLRVKYQPGIDTSIFALSTHPAIVVGDTAYINFNVDIPDLDKGKIFEYYWQVDFYLNFSNNIEWMDTAFVQEAKVYIKGR